MIKQSFSGTDAKFHYELQKNLLTDQILSSIALQLIFITGPAHPHAAWVAIFFPFGEGGVLLGLLLSLLCIALTANAGKYFLVQLLYFSICFN